MWFVSQKIITIEIHSIVLYIKSTIYKQLIHNYIIYKKYSYIIMYSNGLKYKPIAKASLSNQVRMQDIWIAVVHGCIILINCCVNLPQLIIIFH